MTKQSTDTKRARTPLWAIALFGSLAGILLHSKLKLTTTMPRSAYAVPEESEGRDDASTPRVEDSEAIQDQESVSEDVSDPADGRLDG